MRLDELAPAETPATRAALEVVREFSSPALVNHCLRSHLWAASYGRLNGIAYDEELRAQLTPLWELHPQSDENLSARLVV